MSKKTNSAVAEVLSEKTGELIQLEDYLSPAVKVITEQFKGQDDSYIFLSEVGLCAAGTLMLEMDGCVAIVFEGDASTNKSTVLRFFDTVDFVVKTDEFTPASFVSAANNKSEEQLKNIDLLPKIKNKVLIVSDLAPLLAKKANESDALLGILTRVLDGHGLIRNAGTVGGRGYEGDFRFIFLCATTPITKRTHETLSRLGNRLLLVESADSEMTTDDVMKQLSGVLEKKVAICQEAVKNALEGAYKEIGYGGIALDTTVEDEEMMKAIVDLCQVIRLGRAFTDDDIDRKEGMFRTATRLIGLAKCRALLQGRARINRQDVQMVARIAVESLPYNRRKLVKYLTRSAARYAYTSHVMDIYDCSKDTALARMRDLAATGLVYMEQSLEGEMAVGFSKEFSWINNSKYRWIFTRIPRLPDYTKEH